MSAAPLSTPSMSDSTPSCGGTLISIDGRALPLRSARLSGRLRGGLGRITLEQTFHNPYAEPLRVTYQLPLPEDGAVSGFSFRIGEREIVGEVDRKERARERFEQAIAEGRSAAHLEQERASLFTQEVGNIPPETTVVVTIEVDQRLVWARGWEWRFPTVVAPRYLGTPGRVPDASKVVVTAADQSRPITMALDMTIADELPAGAAPSSPSHALSLGRGGLVQFASEGVGLDRDIVLRWPVSTPKVGLSVDVGRPKAGHAKEESLFGLLTVVPPSIRPDAPLARDLVVLLDTSGSMSGEPLAQAKRVTSALIEGLSDRDTLELIEFSSRPRRFAKAPIAAGHSARKKALRWVSSLNAGGGTEMVSGILAALEGVRAEAQRQVVVITDGLIGFERDVVSAIIDKLPSGSRVHTVGVGSAVNRSLTGPAARAGRGLEVVIGLGEDPERATSRLLERTQDPIVVDLEIEGDALLERAPERLPDLYAGSPALISVKLAKRGGMLRLRGRTAAGVWEAQVEARAPADGQGSPSVITCYAREKVEDLELQRTAGANAQTTDAAIAELGLAYQIATRLTSWVAISDTVDVDPSDPSRRELVPQEIPYGMSVEGLGLRAAAVAASGGPPPMGAPAPAPARARAIRRRGAALPPPPASSPQPKKAKGGVISRLLGRAEGPQDKEIEAEGFGGGGFADDDAPAEMSKLEAAAFEAMEELEEDVRGEAPNLARSGQLLPVEVRGVVVSKTDETWIVELVGMDGLHWAPGSAVTILFTDGTAVQAAVITDGTTRTGAVPAGTRVRLVLRPSQSSPSSPRSLTLESDGRRLTVVF